MGLAARAEPDPTGPLCSGAAGCGMNIVFDIGQVLIRWDPARPLIAAGMTAEEAAAALAEMDFPAWNVEQDRGRSAADGIGVLEAVDPRHADWGRIYLDGFAHAIAEPIAGTWDLLEALGTGRHRLFAITNWPADTWPVAERLYPGLSIFEDIVVSGRERMIKPDRPIFDLLCLRHGLAPENCLFIDDSPRNVTGAREAGWDGLLFTTPEALRDDLGARGLL